MNTRKELYERAGVDAKTLRSIEEGERWTRELSRSRIESALGWNSGSLESIRDGGEPTELTPSQLRHPSRHHTVLGQYQLEEDGASSPFTESPTTDSASSLRRIRASFRENIGRHGVTPDLVRTVAAGHLSAVVSQLDAPRRDQVVELAYRLLDEQESEGGNTGADDGGTQSDDLAARRDSNTPPRSIRNVVDDDDPTAGIDWRDYAAHPKTDPLEEDNPTP